MVDMDRHGINAVEFPGGMRRCQDGGGNPLPAAEVAPSEIVRSSGGFDPGDQSDMIEPRGRQHRFEVSQVRDVRYIVADIARHRLFSGASDETSGPDSARSNKGGINAISMMSNELVTARRRLGAAVAEGQVVERKLAAIFAADVAQYSRLMGLDEIGTLRRLQAYRAILDRSIAAHHGRIFNTAGDSVVADFASAVEAVECAIAVQEEIVRENENRPAGERMRFRIGVHLGDVIVEGDNLFGDGVNIAARLQALAEPGGICLSGAVRDQLGTKLPVTLTALGERRFKNIADPVRAFSIGATPARTTEGWSFVRAWRA